LCQHLQDAGPALPDIENVPPENARRIVQSHATAPGAGRYANFSFN
jgi:hypothetical protein